MAVRVGINGFGRIGRNVFRAAQENDPDVEIVAVNDITDQKTLAPLLKYGPGHGRPTRLLRRARARPAPSGREGRGRPPLQAHGAHRGPRAGPHGARPRARAAATTLAPASTGAAKAIGLVIPELNGKLNGFAVRAPVPTGSVIDLVAETERETSVEEVNAALKAASESGPLQGLLRHTEDPIVSSDIVKN